jgi:hypothetical protein
MYYKVTWLKSVPEKKTNDFRENIRHFNKYTHNLHKYAEGYKSSYKPVSPGVKQDSVFVLPENLEALDIYLASEPTISNVEVIK